MKKKKYFSKNELYETKLLRFNGGYELFRVSPRQLDGCLLWGSMLEIESVNLRAGCGETKEAKMILSVGTL